MRTSRPVPHASNGYCRSCLVRMRQRYDALRRKWEVEHPKERDGVDPKSQAVNRLMGMLGGWF